MFDCVCSVVELQKEIHFFNEHRILLLLVAGGGATSVKIAHI